MLRLIFKSGVLRERGVQCMGIGYIHRWVHYWVYSERGDRENTSQRFSGGEISTFVNQRLGEGHIEKEQIEGTIQVVEGASAMQVVWCLHCRNTYVHQYNTYGDIET